MGTMLRVAARTDKSRFGVIEAFCGTERHGDWCFWWWLGHNPDDVGIAMSNEARREAKITCTTAISSHCLSLIIPEIHSILPPTNANAAPCCWPDFANKFSE